MRRGVVLQPGTKLVRLGGRPPRGTLGILVAMVALLLLYAFAGGPRWVPAWLGVSGATTLGKMRLYQPLTALWIHTNPGDLVWSGLTVWLVGGALERWWGRKRLLIFFVVTGATGLLCGALLGLALDPGRVLSGAGGAAVALLVAMALVFPHHSAYLYGLLPLKTRPLALILAGFMLVGSLMAGRSLQLAVQLGGALAALPFLLRTGQPGGGGGSARGKRRLGVIDGGKSHKGPRVWN